MWPVVGQEQIDSDNNAQGTVLLSHSTQSKYIYRGVLLPVKKIYWKNESQKHHLENSRLN
jgi:hypothetical protein